MTASVVAPPSAGRAPALGRLFALIAVVSFGAVGVALVSQHAFGMEPCPWCVLQRLVFVAIGVLALIGLAWKSVAASRVVAGLGLVLALCGIAAAFWQHFVAAKSQSCNLTLADKVMTASQLDRLLPDVFEARASCADAAVSLFGVPYAFWAALVFVVCAVALVRALRAGA